MTKSAFSHITNFGMPGMSGTQFYTVFKNPHCGGTCFHRVRSGPEVLHQDIVIAAAIHRRCHVDGGAGRLRYSRSRKGVGPISVLSAIRPGITVIGSRKIQRAWRSPIASAPVTESAHSQSTNLSMPGMRGAKFLAVFKNSQCGRSHLHRVRSGPEVLHSNIVVATVIRSRCCVDDALSRYRSSRCAGPHLERLV